MEEVESSNLSRSTKTNLPISKTLRARSTIFVSQEQFGIAAKTSPGSAAAAGANSTWGQSCGQRDLKLRLSPPAVRLDCHGAHVMRVLRFVSARRQFRFSGS